jgi:hypothetical protein
MTCHDVRRRLSPLMDAELPLSEMRTVQAHLRTCDACADALASLRAGVDALRALPRLTLKESLAAEVRHRIEVQSRGPGLALLFRPAWMARPLIFPSLVPAALVLVSILAAVAALDRDPTQVVEHAVATAVYVPPSGTEGNPLFPSEDVSSPQVRTRGDLGDVAWADVPEGSLFVETVVARDGTVSDVTVLHGDSAFARRVMASLRREQFEPGRRRGRPVAVSIYRLISHMEVRANAIT